MASFIAEINIQRSQQGLQAPTGSGHPPPPTLSSLPSRLPPCSSSNTTGPRTSGSHCLKALSPDLAGNGPSHQQLSTHVTFSERSSPTTPSERGNTCYIHSPDFIFLLSTYCYMMHYIFAMFIDFVCWFTAISLEPGSVLAKESKGTPLIMHCVGLPHGHLQKPFCNKITDSREIY